MFKTCTKCKKLQSVDNFYKQSTTKDGYQYQCRSCSIKRIKQSEKHEQIEILSSTELSARQELDSKQRLANAQLKRKQWYDKTKHLRSAYVRQKLKTDPLFKLRHNLKNLIRNSIKNKGFFKNTKTEKILGCSIIEFRQYIERQFTNGMSWENLWSLGVRS